MDVDAEHLAEQVGRALRVRRVRVFPGRDIEVVVGAEADPPGIVVGRARQVVEADDGVALAGSATLGLAETW